MAIIGGGSGLGGLTGGNITARLLIVVSGDARPLQAALGSATSSMAAFNKNANALGNAITRTISLPLIGLGAVAIKTASDFQWAMGRVAGLTDIVNQQGYTIDKLSEKMLQLAEVVPTAPTELAKALYFAGSAGLTATAALQTVELAAKGAAIGMGSAADLAKVLVFAYNAYRPAAETVAQETQRITGYMDQLTAAIRTGTAEPDEMAIALGRVIPVARIAGVSFSDVVASLAALTNIGLPARVATTSLRAVISELLAPTQQAAIKLKELGLSSQEVRDALRAGPIVAFQLLTKAVDGDFDALRRLLPQIRGFTAYAALMNDKGAQATRIFNEVRNSTGSLDRAFRIISQTTQVKFALALNQLRIAGIRLGADLFPVFLKLIDFIGHVGKAFQALPTWVQKSAAALIVFGAALGPLIKLYAFLQAGNFGLLTSFRGVLSAVTMLTVGVISLATAWSSATHGTLGVVGELAAVAGAAAIAYIAIANLGKIMDVVIVKGAFTNAGPVLARVVEGLLMLGEHAAIAAAAVAAIVGIGLLLVNSMNADKEALKRFSDALDQFSASSAITQAAVRKLIDANKDYGFTFRMLVKETDSWGKTFAASINPLRRQIIPDLIRNLRHLRDEVTRTGHEGGDIIPTSKFREAVVVVNKTIGILGKFRGSTVSVTKLLAKEGITADELRSAINTLGESYNLNTNQIKALIGESDKLQRFFNDLRDQTEAQVVLYGMNEDAIKKLAGQYGVSAEMMSNALSKVGVDALGLVKADKSVQDEFAKVAGIAKSASNESIAAAEARAKAEQEAADSIRQSLQGEFDMFAKLPDKVKASVLKLNGNLSKQVVYYEQFASNVQTLLRRGLNPQVLQELVTQGPAMVARFVGASDKELRKLETSYSIVMGAIDAIVLNEGQHQEGKGINMVAGFAEAILSQKGITTAAAQQIMQTMQTQFVAGKWGAFALAGMQNFVAILTGPGLDLSRSAASKVALAFTNKLANDPSFPKSGYNSILRWAQGAEKAGKIPKGTAKSIADAVQTAFNEVSTKGPSIQTRLDQARQHLMQVVNAESQDTKEKVLDLHTEIDNMPTSKVIDIKVDTGGADTQLQAWLHKVMSTQVHVIVHASWAMAGGGLVPGGYGGGDRVPTMLEPGEFVLRKEAVKEHGLGRVKEWNRMQQGGLVGKINNADMLYYNFPQPGGAEMELGATEWAKANIRSWFGGGSYGVGTPGARRYQGFVNTAIPGGWRFGVVAHRFIHGTHVLSQHNWGNAVDAFNSQTKMSLLSKLAYAFSAPLRLAHLIWQTSVSSYGGPWHHYSGVPHTGHVHADFSPQYPLAAGGLARRNINAQIHPRELILPLNSPKTERLLGRALAYAGGASSPMGGTHITIPVTIEGPVYGVNDLDRRIEKAMDKAVSKLVTR